MLTPTERDAKHAAPVWLLYSFGALLGGFLAAVALNLFVPVPHGWSSAMVGATLGFTVDAGALLGIGAVFLARCILEE